MNKYLSQAKQTALSDLEQLEQAIDQKNLYLKALNKNIEARELALSDIENKAQEREKGATALHIKRLQDYKDQYSSKEDELKNIASEVLASKKIRDSFREETEDIRGTKELLEVEVETLTNKIAEVRDKLQQHVKEYNVETETLLDKIAQLENKNQALELEVSETEKKLATLKTTHDQSKEEHEQLMARYEKEESEYAAKRKSNQLELKNLIDIIAQTKEEEKERIRQLEIREERVIAKTNALSREQQDLAVEKRQFYSTRSLVD